MKSTIQKQPPLLIVSEVSVNFRIGGGRTIQAVSGVSFDIGTGETLGLVGESGCGKSTLARAIVGLQEPTQGTIFFAGKNLRRCTRRESKSIRPQLQMIFQDAVASLNPGRTIGKAIAEPLRIIGKEDPRQRTQRVHEMMNSVGLDPQLFYSRYPHELSGGQCQRANLARALIANPLLLVCDEPVSSLDVSVQAQIMNLLEGMKRQFALTMMFISHDLAVVKNVSDRVAVMYLGRVCEIAAAEDLYRSPHHPYTALLLASIPQPDPEQRTVRTTTNHQEMPSPANPPPGCRFHTRCLQAQDICGRVEPELANANGGGKVACHFPM